MEENNNLEIIELEPEVEDESSNALVPGLIGLGIGVFGTLLAKKGVKTVKNLIAKRKARKITVEIDDDFEDDSYETVDNESK